MIFEAGNQTAFDAAIAKYHGVAEAANTASQFRWFIDRGTWSFNTKSPFEWMTRLQECKLEKILDKIPGLFFVTDLATGTFFLVRLRNWLIS